MTKRIIIWFVIIIVIAGGAIGYFYYLQMPEKIIKNMVSRMNEVKFLGYDAQIEFEYNLVNLYLPSPFGEIKEFLQPGDRPEKIMISLNGAFDVYDFDNPKTIIELSANPSFQKIAAELRIINKIVYFKLVNVPKLKFIDLDFLINQWVKIDLKMTRNQREETMTQTEIFKFIERMPSEQIDGIDTYHYKVLINKDAFIKLIAKNNILLEGVLGGLDSIINGEIWIGKSDLLLHKVYMVSITEGAENGEVFAASIQFKDYDKLVQINTPVPVKTLEDILNEFSEGLVEEILTDDSIKIDSE